MAIKVLLATTVGWPSAGRLAGAFVTAGCTVDAILPSGHPAAESRYFAHRHFYRALAGSPSFREALKAAQYDLIVPLDDRAVCLLLDLHANATPGIASSIERSLGGIGAYGNLMSRAGFIDSARAADICAPQTRAVASQQDLEDALGDIGFPAVLKADLTWGGDGVVIAHDREQALAAFHHLSDPPPRLRSLVRAIKRSDAHYLLAALHAKPGVISIQQFVPGVLVTTSMACWQGRVLAANHLEVVVAQGATGPASVVRRIDNSQMDTAAANLAARFALSGLHGLDYVRDARGQVHLIEINPRAPQSSHLNFGAGHDLAAALARAAGAQAFPPRSMMATDTVALFPQEWMRDPASPYLKSAYHDVPWDDPALIRAWLTSIQSHPARREWDRFQAGSDERIQAGPAGATAP